MTVASVDADIVNCEWFADGNPRTGTFSATVLEARVSQAEGLKRMNDALKTRGPPRRI
jgi:hypothetical protein